MAPHLAAVLSPSPDVLSRRFQRLAAQWKTERGATSAVEEMVMHPAYQQIIGMGPAIVPLLLKELQREPDHWFWALKAITDEDPVPASSCGRISEMAQAWIVWGRANNLI